MLLFMKRNWKFIGPWLFPIAVLCVYAAAMFFDPESAARGLKVSRNMFSHLALPFCVVLVMMVLLNRYMNPAGVARYLGGRTGLKGIVLSSLAGIISLGPIYAWYPLFKELKERGASLFMVANFIGCRSVKPVLFPVLLSYFGWKLASMFVLMSLFSGIVTACVVTLFCSTDKQGGR